MEGSAIGRWSAVIVAAALGASGCYYGGGFAEPGATVRTNPPADSYAPTPLVQSAWLEGAMGDVVAERGTGVTATATVEPGLRTIRIDAENTSARWWAMTQVEFSSAIDLRTTPIGTVIGPYASDGPFGNAPTIYNVQGCSGPSHGDWNYDEHATQMTVRVAAGSRPDTRTLEIAATFDGSAVHGAVEVQVP